MRDDPDRIVADGQDLSALADRDLPARAAIATVAPGREEEKPAGSPVAAARDARHDAAGLEGVRRSAAADALRDDAIGIVADGRDRSGIGDGDRAAAAAGPAIPADDSAATAAAGAADGLRQDAVGVFARRADVARLVGDDAPTRAALPTT